MFLWVSFGGTLPLAAGELPLQGRVPGGLAAREGGGRADGRREHRQGEAEGARAGRALHGRGDGDRPPLRADRTRRARDPAPEEPPRRDLRGDHAGQPGRAEARRRRDARRARRSTTRSAGRGVPRVRPRRRARAFQQWLHEAGIVTTGHASRATSTTRSGTRRRSSRAAPTCCGRWPSRRWRSGACSATPAACSTPCRARTASCSGLITNGDATFGALASRDDALAETFQIFPTFLRETRATVRRLEAFASNTDPLVRDLR